MVGTGIGAACARRFAEEGAHVCVLGRRKDLIEKVAADVAGLALVADASQTPDMKNALRIAADRFGGIDVLVANAGGHGLGDAIEYR